MLQSTSRTYVTCTWFTCTCRYCDAHECCKCSILIRRHSDATGAYKLRKTLASSSLYICVSSIDKRDFWLLSYIELRNAWRVGCAKRNTPGARFGACKNISAFVSFRFLRFGEMALNRLFESVSLHQDVLLAFNSSAWLVSISKFKPMPTHTLDYVTECFEWKQV